MSSQDDYEKAIESQCVEEEKSSKLCRFAGCKRLGIGPLKLCMGHGGGKRCTFPGCCKGATGKHGLCRRHHNAVNASQAPSDTARSPSVNVGRSAESADDANRLELLREPRESDAQCKFAYCNGCVMLGDIFCVHHMKLLLATVSGGRRGAFLSDRAVEKIDSELSNFLESLKPRKVLTGSSCLSGGRTMINAAAALGESNTSHPEMFGRCHEDDSDILHRASVEDIWNFQF